MTPAPQNAREQLAAVRERDAKANPHCRQMFVSVDGRPLICGMARSVHGRTVMDHEFVPPPTDDRRFLLGLVDELAAAGSNVLDWADAALCRWCGARAGSLASVHDDSCPVGALRALLDTLR